MIVSFITKCMKSLRCFNTFSKSDEKYFMLNTEDYTNLSCHDECGICLEPLKYSPCIKTEECNHFFHRHCYKTYLSNTKVRKHLGCPFCDTNQDNLNIYMFQLN